jgi:hypothetical protein
MTANDAAGNVITCTICGKPVDPFDPEVRQRPPYRFTHRACEVGEAIADLAKIDQRRFT